MLAAYSFGDVMWTMLVFFAWILFFWMLFAVFGDLFGRHDISGWGKAGWTIFVIFLPFLGVFIYLIAEGKSMGERAMASFGLGMFASAHSRSTMPCSLAAIGPSCGPTSTAFAALSAILSE